MQKEYKLKQRGLFKPGDAEPFKVSRSGIELFVNCPCCFYLSNVRGISRPSGPPFNINTAVDTLLKKEFDYHRAGQTQHPYMAHYGIDAVPFQHDDMDKWRENFKGVRFVHEPSNLLVTGAVDDVWQNNNGELIVVDYKATSKTSAVTIEEEWQMGYKRQMEVYQWLLRQNGFEVSNRGYFVYCNGRTDLEAFDGKIEFDVTLLPYDGNDSWVEGTLMQMRKCLDNPSTPTPSKMCEFCGYAEARQKEQAGEL